MRWFPWPSGPGGGSHVSGPELEPGLLPQADTVSASGRPGVQGAGTSPPWDVPALRWGDTGRLAEAVPATLHRLEKARIPRRTKFKSAVTGDSLLPVILKLSASHI